MTNVLLGGILCFAVATTIEAYLLLGRVQLVMTHAELILRALHTLLREVPSKSARRTVAAIDEKPRPWFQTLRRLAELRDWLDLVFQPTPLDDGDVDEDLVDEDAHDLDEQLDRWADDGGAPALEDVKDTLTAVGPVAGDVDTEPETTVDEDTTPTETFDRIPATAPFERVDLAGGLRLPPEGREPTEPPRSPPIVDEVDLQLVRFGLRTAEGHRP
jgi:hypothetical protein